MIEKVGGEVKLAAAQRNFVRNMSASQGEGYSWETVADLVMR